MALQSRTLTGVSRTSTPTLHVSPVKIVRMLQCHPEFKKKWQPDTPNPKPVIKTAKALKEKPLKQPKLRTKGIKQKKAPFGAFFLLVN